MNAYKAVSIIVLGILAISAICLCSVGECKYQSADLETSAESATLSYVTMSTSRSGASWTFNVVVEGDGDFTLRSEDFEKIGCYKGDVVFQRTANENGVSVLSYEPKRICLSGRGTIDLPMDDYMVFHVRVC